MKFIYSTLIIIWFILMLFFVLATHGLFQKFYIIGIFIMIIIWYLLFMKISRYINKKYKKVSRKYNKFIYIGEEAREWGIIGGVGLFIADLLFTNRLSLDSKLKREILLFRVLSILTLASLILIAII